MIEASPNLVTTWNGLVYIFEAVQYFYILAASRHKHGGRRSHDGGNEARLCWPGEQTQLVPQEYGQGIVKYCITRVIILLLQGFFIGSG